MATMTDSPDGRKHIVNSVHTQLCTLCGTSARSTYCFNHLSIDTTNKAWRDKRVFGV